MAKKKKNDFKFSPKQLKVLKFPYESNKDGVICDGAIKSGKSAVEIIGFILWSMGNFNLCNFIIASNTVGAALRNIVRPVQRIKYMQKNFQISHSISKGYMEVRRGNKVNYYYIYGGSNEKSQDVVQGGVMCGAFFDEVALMKESFVNQCIARCSDPHALLWFNCNPESPTHWFKKEWVDKAKEKNIMYLHFTMEDNPSLTEKVKEKYRRQFPSGVFKQRYILGLWTKAEGIIYKTFADNPEKFILKEVPKNWKLNFIDIGIDFGGTKSATSFVLKGIYNNFHDIVILKSDKLEGEDYNMKDLENKFLKFEKEVFDEFNLYFNTFCDNAEPVLIRTLKGCSKYSAVRKAKKSSIFGRIKATITLMDLGRFWIREEADTVKDALLTAVWSDKHPDERLDDGTSDIDTLDGMEYSFENDIKKLMYVNLR